MGLFNRPTATVAATAGSSSDQPSDIFSHSQSFNAILAEQAQRRKEKQEKQRGKSDGKRKSEEGTEESPMRQKRDTPKKEKTEESPKRRRISGQDVGKLLEASGIFGGTVGGGGLWACRWRVEKCLGGASQLRCGLDLPDKLCLHSVHRKEMAGEGARHRVLGAGDNSGCWIR